MHTEIDIHRRIIHENIIQLFSHHETESHLFLVCIYKVNKRLMNMLQEDLYIS